MTRIIGSTLAVVAFAFLTSAAPAATAEELALYDKFESTHIDPAKWLVTSGDPDVREVVRRLSGEDEDRRLHLALRAYAATTDDTGGSGNLFGVKFPKPYAITETSFSVVVKEAEVAGCTSNSSLIVTDAEFRSNFFENLITSFHDCKF